MINFVVFIGDRKAEKVSENREGIVNSNTGTDLKLLNSFWKPLRAS